MNGISNPKSTASIAGHPLHPMLVPFPIAFLVGTLVTDIVYARSLDPFWAGVSYWLLAAALVMAALAAVAGSIDFWSERRIRDIRASWYHMIGNVIAVVLSLYNFWLRHDGGVHVGASDGLWISAVVVLLLLVNGWFGWELVYRHRVGVSDEIAPPR
jgi:uncharacterized membrane protein